jgi:hypothetical protein
MNIAINFISDKIFQSIIQVKRYPDINDKNAKVIKKFFFPQIYLESR